MAASTQPARRFDGAHPASDEEAIAKVLAGDTAYFEILMRRHNEMVYRVLRARMSDESRVEDAMQRTYLNSFRALRQFERRSKFSTWLVRIALRESYRDKAPLRLVAGAVQREEPLDELHRDHPEQQLQRAELGAAIQRATEQLPESLKLVFLLRDVQQLSSKETAAAVDIDEGAVRVRLHRARARLRAILSREFADALPTVFAFHAPRCDRVVAAVLQQILPAPQQAPTTL